MKEMTVKDLAMACKQQIAKGNGDKIILLSDDDEGNGYHTMYYLFTDSKESVAACLELEHDDHNADEVVILG